MVLFADIILDPASVVAWLVIGVVAAWLVATLIAPPTYGMIGDILVGAGGALIGWLVYGFVVAGPPGFWVSALFAFVGAFVGITGARRLAARDS